MANTIQRSFAGGELAPALHARADLARYAIGLRTCRNLVVLRAGGATKRPGTRFVVVIGTQAAFTLTIAPTTMALDGTTPTGAVTATLLDASSNPVTGQTITWETDDGTIATIASSGSLTALVTAVASGSTSIRARCPALGLVSNDCVVTVTGKTIVTVPTGTTKTVNGTVTAYAVGGGAGGDAGTSLFGGGGGGVSSATFSGIGTMTITIGAGGAAGGNGSGTTVSMPGNAPLSVNGGAAGAGAVGGTSGLPTAHAGGSSGGTSNGTDGVTVGGGGGGADGTGGNATLGGGFSGTAGDGGDGLTLIDGTDVLGTFGGGGGGGASTIGTGLGTRGAGGTGGGGNGAVNGNGVAGTPNTGGGGGNGAAGGSGVVILVYDAFNTTVS